MILPIVATARAGDSPGYLMALPTGPYRWRWNIQQWDVDEYPTVDQALAAAELLGYHVERTSGCADVVCPTAPTWVYALALALAVVPALVAILPHWT